MKYILFIGLGHKPVSAHDSLDDALRELRRKWIAPKGNMNIGWWFSPQFDDSGAIEWLGMRLPDRPMTDAEIEAQADTPRIAARWKIHRPRTTDFERAEMIVSFPSRRIDCAAIVREDRAIQGMADAEIEGNDVSGERRAVLALLMAANGD